MFRNAPVEKPKRLIPPSPNALASAAHNRGAFLPLLNPRKSS